MSKKVAVRTHAAAVAVAEGVKRQTEAIDRLRALNAELVEVLVSARGLIAEIGNVDAFKQLTDAELGKVWVAVFNQCDAAIAKARSLDTEVEQANGWAYA